MPASNPLSAEMHPLGAVSRPDGHATIYRLPNAVSSRPARRSSGEIAYGELRLVEPETRRTPGVARRAVLVATMVLVYAATFATAWMLVHGVA